MIVNNCAFGYLSQRIVFYLLNLHIKSRQTYFCRAGTTKEEDSYKADASLSEEGEDYARKMTETLIKHRETERQNLIKNGAPESTASKPLGPVPVGVPSKRHNILVKLATPSVSAVR
jgi:6-phosphofructo-2-kinase/fructose-2,6-biphosphatase 4